MRLLALLCFFDEPEDLLVLHLDGLARAGVTHVVAADGRYQLFPSDLSVSPARQRAVIDAACQHHGMGLTMLVPPGPWVESEPEKRTWLFSMAMASSLAGDWWLNADADMIATEWPDDLFARLGTTDHAVADVRLTDTLSPDRPEWPRDTRFRALYRAQPILVQGHHCDYDTPDGLALWRGADYGFAGLASALDLTSEFVIEHRPRRDAGRTMAKNQWYARRDGMGLEMGTCTRCAEHATERVHSGPRMLNGMPTARIEEVCATHAKELDAARRRWLLQHDMNPDVQFNERYLGIEPVRR